MNETEVDALVARLVPEFELNKLQAIDARREYLTLASRQAASDAAATHAFRRWQALETACSDILRRIDELAERSYG